MGKLCKDQLVGRLVAIVVVVLLVGGGATFTATAQADETLVQKLVSLFRGHKQIKIDDAVAQAKNALTQEAKQAKKNDLEKLFDSQIKTLKDRGVPKQIVEIIQNQKGSALQKASEMTFGDGNIPFLPVIPRSYRSPYDLMAMVKNGGKAGYTYLNPTEISDVVDAPQEPYYIYDVEDGSSMRDKSPESAEEALKWQKRSPLTAAEVMALTTHADVLSKHYVLATGSRYEHAGRVPNVYLGYGGRPWLDWYYIDFSFDRWGAASCGSR